MRICFFLIKTVVLRRIFRQPPFFNLHLQDLDRSPLFNLHAISRTYTAPLVQFMLFTASLLNLHIIYRVAFFPIYVLFT